MKVSPSIRHNLYCPGPVNTHPSVKRAVAENEIGHREPEFSVLLRSIQEKLLALYKVSEEVGYHAVVVTGSGTAANETVLSSVVGKQNILILANGEFGERLYDVSSLHNPETTHKLDFGWSQNIDVAAVEQYLQTHDIDIVAMVHHETSTGMLNPIKEIGVLTHRLGKQFMIDTVSSAGAEIIDLAECHVTFCTGSASKAICSLPGVAYVIGQVAAFERLANIPPRTMYLNLYKFYTYSVKYRQTPNTPAVQSFFAFEQALANLLHKGIEQTNAELQARADYLRSQLAKVGFTFLIPVEQMSSLLTTVNLPKQLAWEKLQGELKQRNIVIYGGKGPFSGKIFQVANIGEISHKDLAMFVKILEKVYLDSLSLRKRPFSTKGKLTRSATPKTRS